LIHKLEKLGSAQLGKMVERASHKAEEAYAERLARLHALSQQNPKLSPLLVAEVKAERDAVLAAIKESQLVLDGLMLVCCGKLPVWHTNGRRETQIQRPTSAFHCIERITAHSLGGRMVTNSSAAVE